MRPHVDLSKTYVDVNKKVHCSTFTFLLHLRNSGVLDGGETVLLEKLSGSDGKNNNVLASIKPKRGRLLIFPHICPHAGLVVNTPGTKIFLRGELYVDKK